MPEASVNEDHSLMLRKNKIRSAGQFTLMQSKTKAKRVRCFSHHKFRSGILTSNA